MVWRRRAEKGGGGGGVEAVEVMRWSIPNPRCQNPLCEPPVFPLPHELGDVLLLCVSDLSVLFSAGSRDIEKESEYYW
jgi:hypothetical protein